MDFVFDSGIPRLNTILQVQFHRHILEQPHRLRLIQINHYIHIAVLGLFTTRARAEQVCSVYWLRSKEMLHLRNHIGNFCTWHLTFNLFRLQRYNKKSIYANFWWEILFLQEDWPVWMEFRIDSYAWTQIRKRFLNTDRSRWGRGEVAVLSRS